MTDRILRARKRVRTPPSIREGWNDGVLLTLGGKCIAGQDVGVQKAGRGNGLCAKPCRPTWDSHVSRL